MSKVIDVYDDVFEDHNAIILDDNVRQIHWKYDYRSNKKEVNKHWHVFCGHNKKECDESGFDWVHLLFESAKNKIGKEIFLLLTQISLLIFHL